MVKKGGGIMRLIIELIINISYFAFELIVPGEIKLSTV